MAEVDTIAGDKHARVWRRRRRFFALILVLGVVIHYGSLASLYWLPENASRRTYMSENALAPAQGHITYSQRQLTRGLSWNATDAVSACARITKVGLPCYRTDRNVVYTVVRAPKTNGKEALLLSTTMDSFGLALSLLHHLSAQAYLSRDVFFVVSVLDDARDVHHWLKCYMGECSLDLRGARGRLEAAINLDVVRPSVLSRKGFDYVVIEAPSVLSGGSLPNLDLLNTFVAVCHSQRMYDTRLAHPFLPDYVPRAMNQFLSFMLQCVWPGTVRSDVHGVFNRYQVEAITVSTEGGAHANGQMSLIGFMRSIEGTFRSLNNLQERLHQSFYFYVLTSTQRYISIADYMIPFGGALFLLPIRMLTEYYDPDVTSDLLRGASVLSVYAIGGLVMWFLPSANASARVLRHVGFSLICFGAAPSQRAGDYGVKTVTLMMITLYCIAASLVNWPFAMVSVALLVPTLTFVRPSGGYLQFALLCLVDPAMFYVGSVYFFGGAQPPPLVWGLLTLVYWPAHRAMIHTTLKG